MPDRAPAAAYRLRTGRPAGLLLTLALLGGCGLAPDDADDTPATQPLSQAQRWIEAAEAAGTAGPALPARLTRARWTDVELPDRAAAASAVPAGRAVLAWYRLQVPLPPDAPAAPWGVYIPRVAGAAAQVYLNGVKLLDNTPQAREQWNRPLMIAAPAAPPDAPTDGTAELIVALPQAANGRSPALSTVWVGPLHDIRAMAERRYWLQVTGPQAGALATAVLGVFALGFWWRRPREHAYLLFGASSLLWWLHNLHYHADVPQAAWAEAALRWLTHASIGWIVFLTYLFALHLQGMTRPPRLHALAGLTLLTSLITLCPGPWPAERLLLLQHAAQLAVSAGVLAFITADAAQRRQAELTVLAAALWALLAMGTHDLLLAQGVVPPQSIYLLPYGSLMLTGAFLYAAQRRYLRALREIESANATLEARLREQHAQLQAGWRRLHDTEQTRAVLRERQRLVRDMHDGVGSALMSSLVLVEQGQLPTPAVAEVLRECMDDIKLVIDSMEPVDRDLVALLASLRHRLGRRMERAGMRFEWQVGELPRLDWLDAAAALQVLRIVQESLTNVLKHARAGCVSLSTELHDDESGRWVRVVIADDGTGFDPARVPHRGRGLANLRHRARLLRGRLDVHSQPGHTRVTLDLPLQAAEAAVTA